MVSHPVKIAFVTDRGYLRPTLVAMWSLLEHLSRPAEIHFWGDDLSEADWQAVSRVAAIRPDCRLITKALGAAELEGANNKSSYITATTMARLFIPRHIDGRVLYVDGDTLIVGDVSPLFNIDLGGSLVAAVRDEPTAKQVVKRIQRADRMRPAALARLQAVSEITDPKTYANAGVLLFDCDDIRETPNLLEKLEDLVTASAFPMADQDHINMVLAGRIHFLNPAYNSSWGRTKEQREYISVIDGLETEQMQTSDVVVHYHGPDKPWHRVRLDLWDKRARATLSYRRQLRRYLRAFPDLAPPAKG